MDELERKEEGMDGQEISEPSIADGESPREESPGELESAGEASPDLEDVTERDAESPMPQSDPEEPAGRLEENGESNPEVTVEAVAEAVLFASDESLPLKKLSEIVGAGGAAEMRKIIEGLNARYEQMGCSFRIEEIAGGVQMLTLPVFNVWLKKLVKVRGETKLTPAALETLAIIAYKQPVLRVDVEAIRGVAAGEMIRQLIEKGLVKIVGRAEELGRPLLYGTTKKFLETFGLGSLKDLPTNEDLKKPQD